MPTQLLSLVIVSGLAVILEGVYLRSMLLAMRNEGRREVIILKFKIDQLMSNQDQLATDLSAIKDAIGTVATNQAAEAANIATLATSVTDLRNQLANGGVAPALVAQADALVAQVTAAATTSKTNADAVAAILTPPAAAPAGETAPPATNIPPTQP